MLRYIAAKKLSYDVILLFGNNSWEEIPFRDELAEFAVSHRAIRVEHVLSGPDVPAAWKGKRGHVNNDLVAELIPDYRERLFYLSGPPKLVLSLQDQLSGLSVPSERIKLDSFTGYD